MKKNLKILFIITIFIMIFCTFSNQLTYAADDFKAGDYIPGVAAGDSKLKDIGNRIIGPVSVIGSLVSVIAIIAIGIKYMLGSVEEKAQYKETLGPYFLGAVLVFGIITVLTIVRTIAESIQ